ncbi:hypothetical protein [Methylobacterium oxalidis]|uniref:hypothetical protein n=1 Tax=Methylobacterium oxalidis TaxID=944322 RepID=UPI0033157F1B
MNYDLNGPAHPDRPPSCALLNRAECAKLLTEAGYPTSRTTLATLASRGGGPLYRKYGRIAVYRWSDALEWAEARLGTFRTTAAEGALLNRNGAQAQGGR